LCFRNLLLEEFFANNNPISLEGPLYLKSESKKGWKRYHFVLRQSGLYYYPKEKEKVKSSKDLMCLALFNSHNVYKGVGWKKKYKAPTDHSFALKCPKANIPGKGMKMLCAEDSESLEKWIMCCRIAKFGKKLVDNFKNLVEDLARDDLDKLASTRLSFTPINTQISPDKLSVNSSQNGRSSRASTSSSSSGCLSDDNNGFEAEFTTGTIKRKPTIKPNLPLTTKTRQLIKEVEDMAARSDNSDSLEKGGTLTRRRSHSSSSNGTLKRQGSTRCSIDSLKSPVTPEEPSPPSIDVVDSSVKFMSSCMTDSMLSLPPPPEPTTCAMSASSLSLNSLPFPEPPDENVLKELSMSDPMVESQTSSTLTFSDETISNKSLNYAIPSTNGCATIEVEPIYKTILKPPPYKSPPVHNKYSLPPPVPQKSVTFADSPAPPVVFRKKVCFDDQVEKILVSPRQEKPPPMPPLRDRNTFLTCTSPKRLCESSSNPPQDFWKDLQRVVNKKLGVAQKCKMNLQMSPGEVLGFRDAEPTYEQSTYYRETSTSNWVLEHYGDNLYENWDGSKVNGAPMSPPMSPKNGVVLRDNNSLPKQNLPLSPRRSTRGPPVPIRNSSTRLSTGSGTAAEMQ
jgi:Ras-associated and pleckstrin homology domains-containing protein 1